MSDRSWAWRAARAFVRFAGPAAGLLAGLAGCGLWPRAEDTARPAPVEVTEAAELAHPGPVTALAFGEGGKTLLAAGADELLSNGDAARRGGFIHLWRWREGALQARWSYPRPVTAVAVAPDGRRWTAGDGEGRLIFSDEPTRVPEKSEDQRRAITALAVSPDGRWVAAGSLDPRYPLGLYHIASRGMVKPDMGFAPVAAVAFSPDSLSLAVGFEHGGLVVWNFAGPAPQVVSRPRRPPGVRSVAFSPDGRLLAYGTGEGRVTVLSWRTNRPLMEAASPSPISALTFSPDGRLLAVGWGDGTVRLLDPVRGDVLWRRAEGAPVTGLAVSAEGRALAVSVGHRVRVYRMMTGAPGRLGRDATAALAAPEPTPLR